MHENYSLPIWNHDRKPPQKSANYWTCRRGVAFVLILGSLLQASVSSATSLSTTSSKTNALSIESNLDLVKKPFPLPPSRKPNNPNLIPNPSAESVQSSNSTLPSGGWDSVANTNSAVTYALVNPGHTGARAFNVSIQSYGGGEAFWKYPPQSVTPGKTYEFSDAYISDTNTAVWLYLIDKNGTETVRWLGDTYKSPDWNRFYGQFTVPEDVVSVGVYHSISSKGFLITDDYNLDEYAPLPLHRPLVSLSFDDGLAPVYSNALPLLQKFHFLSTQFLPTGFIDQKGRFTRSMVQDFSRYGHEVASHSVTHPFLTNFTKDQLDQEFMQSQQQIFSITGIRPTSLATPYGSYNPTVIKEASNYFQFVRNVNVGFNSRDNADSFDIKVQNITASTTINDIKTWVSAAKRDRIWLVLVYHNVSDDVTNAGFFNTPPGELERHFQLIQASGIAVLPINQAATELKAQSFSIGKWD